MSLGPITETEPALTVRSSKSKQLGSESGTYHKCEYRAKRDARENQVKVILNFRTIK